VFIADLAELVALAIGYRSAGVLNVATGTTSSFRELAEAVVRLSGRSAQIVGTPRVGPMPHNGYRAFAIDACQAAFPEFRYTELAEGLARAQAEDTSGPLPN
jgi:nucleoside-diphosphate-sugar epimerase